MVIGTEVISGRGLGRCCLILSGGRSTGPPFFSGNRTAVWMPSLFTNTL